MAGFINIGFGNIVNRDKIVAVVSPDAAPVKRMVQQGKEEKIVIDATQGRRTNLFLWQIVGGRKVWLTLVTFGYLSGLMRKEYLL